MLSKFGNQSAQKQFIFSNKANFERGLLKIEEVAPLIPLSLWLKGQVDFLVRFEFQKGGLLLT